MSVTCSFLRDCTGLHVIVQWYNLPDLDWRPHLLCLAWSIWGPHSCCCSASARRRRRAGFHFCLQVKALEEFRARQRPIAVVAVHKRRTSKPCCRLQDADCDCGEQERLWSAWAKRPSEVPRLELASLCIRPRHSWLMHTNYSNELFFAVKRSLHRFSLSNPDLPAILPQSVQVQSFRRFAQMADTGWSLADNAAACQSCACCVRGGTVVVSVDISAGAPEVLDTNERMNE